MVVIEDWLTEETVTYKKLKAGKYRFQIFVDENKNGKWDTGNFEDADKQERLS